jgi:acetoacetate decarboxylase
VDHSNDKRTRDDRGLLAMSPEKVIGRPFLRPLYGPPPYQYIDDVVAIVAYRADRAAIREVLPAQVVPAPDDMVVVGFFVCPDVTGIGPHDFTIMTIPVEYKGTPYHFCTYLYTSTDASLACYREVHGWPGVMASTEIAADGDRFRARVVRHGHEIIAAEGKVGGEMITSIDFPVLIYKEIPSHDGKRADVSQFVASTSLVTNVKLHAGAEGTIRLSGATGDPIARLQPLEILQVTYGTLDDLYPETIQVV